MSKIPLGRLVDLQTAKATIEPGFKIGLEDIESGTTRLRKVSSDYAGDGVTFAAGDILFGKLRPYLAKVWQADRPGAAVGDFHVYRPRPDLASSRYLTYALVADSFLGPVVSSVYGAKMPRASWDFTRTVEVEVPGLGTQEAIADYLDRETAQIDTLIAKQEQLVAALRERRETAITSAIAGTGLEAEASEDAWYPVTPNGWARGRLKSFSGRITDGAHISPDTDAGEFPFVSTRDVKAGRVDLKGSLRTSRSSYEYLVRTGCRPQRGDVLFSKDGTVGEVAVVVDDQDFVVASSLIIVTPSLDDVSPEYLGYLLQARTSYEQAVAMMRGAGLPRLSVTNFAKMTVILPPLAAQSTIVRYLNAVTAKIDTLIAKAERFIELSKERRAALITAAVTGQIEVPAG